MTPKSVDSFDIHLLPDSQHNLSISILDDDDFTSKPGSRIKRPNFVVEESDSESDSSDTGSSGSTTDFSSDDRVKDPNF